MLHSSSLWNTTIVDTGAGLSNNGGYTIGSYQSLAGQFTITESYTITDIYGWIGKDSNNPETGTFTIELVSGGGQIPDGSGIFSGDANYSVSGPAWQGLTGIDWTIPAGTYWVEFGSRYVYSGYMPRASNPAWPRQLPLKWALDAQPS